MRERGLLPLAAVVAGVLLARPWWEPHPPAGTYVSVDGDVPTAAWFRVDEPRTSAALTAAGWTGALAADLPLTDGDKLHVAAGRVNIQRADAEPLVGDALDLTRADEAELAALPGVGPVAARTYAATRATKGLSRRQTAQLQRYAAAP